MGQADLSKLPDVTLPMSAEPAAPQIKKKQRPKKIPVAVRKFDVHEMIRPMAQTPQALYEAAKDVPLNTLMDTMTPTNEMVGPVFTPVEDETALSAWAKQLDDLVTKEEPQVKPPPAKKARKRKKVEKEEEVTVADDEVTALLRGAFPLTTDVNQQDEQLSVESRMLPLLGPDCLKRPEEYKQWLKVCRVLSNSSFITPETLFHFLCFLSEP